MRRILGVLSAWVALSALAGCVALEPHRTRLAVPGLTCDDARSTTPDCRYAVQEHTDAYDLHFVEFDDQGLQYPDGRTAYPGADGNVTEFVPRACKPEANDCLFGRAWAYQINNVIKALDRAAAKDPIVLLVFIHGWQHDASADDENVRAFRRLLADTALIEANRPKFERDAGGRPVTGARKVVGLYVGWRGRSVDIPGLDNVTFWTRKTAAMHVAEGSSRELFARLRAFKCVQNSGDRRASRQDCGQAPSRADHVKVILIGHSFGGLILYNALSGSLIETMTRAFDTNDDGRDPYWRFADLALLINPAFEATRYAPLHSIAANSAYNRYEPPLLVTVTSTTDDATRVAFKVGRFFNTVFESHADDDEKSANRETVGHHARFLTHRLELATPPNGGCDRWAATDPRVPFETQLDQFGTNVRSEYENSRAFYRANGANVDGVFKLTKEHWVRDFCGGVRLSADQTNANNPIWNVSAIGDRDLLPDHSTIGQPLFVGFFRQLYMDTIFFDSMVNSRFEATIR